MPLSRPLAASLALLLAAGLGTHAWARPIPTQPAPAKPAAVEEPAADDSDDDDMGLAVQSAEHASQAKAERGVDAPTKADPPIRH